MTSKTDINDGKQKFQRSGDVKNTGFCLPAFYLPGRRSFYWCDCSHRFLLRAVEWCDSSHHAACETNHFIWNTGDAKSGRIRRLFRIVRKGTVPKRCHSLRGAYLCSGSCCRCLDKQDPLLVPLPAAWAGNPTKAFATRTALPLIRWMSPRHFAAR